MISDFPSDTMQSKRQQNIIFKVLRKETVNLKLYVQGNIYFKDKGEIRTFSNKQNLREFTSSRGTTIK